MSTVQPETAEWFQHQELALERPQSAQQKRENESQTNIVDEFVENPDSWKEPHESPDGWYPPLVEQFETMFVTESWLATLRPPLSEGTPEYFDHVKALWAQRKEQGDHTQPPTERALFRALPTQERIQGLMYMDKILRTVFEWMREQGQDPIPGLKQWPQTISDAVLSHLEK